MKRCTFIRKKKKCEYIYIFNGTYSSNGSCPRFCFTKIYTSEDLKWNAKGVIDFNLLNINVIFIFKI